MRRERRVAFAAFVVLAAVLVVLVAVRTPWHPLGGGPVPGGAVHPDAARDFTPAQLHRAAALSAALDGPGYGSLAVSLVVVFVLGFTPLGARLIDRATRWLPRRLNRLPLRVAIAVVGLTLLTTLLTLPLGVWGESVVRRYGLSTMDWPAWSLDRLKGFAVNVVTLLIAMLIGYLLMWLWPRRWWLPAALAAFALVIAGSYAYPVLIQPLFSHTTPMRPGPLRSELLHLAARDHVPVRQVLVSDASSRTTAFNAYVTGFGSTRRIVVYDTLLHGAPREQIVQIVAHELGHAEHNDVWHGTVQGAFAAAAAVCLLYVACTGEWLLRRGGLAVAGPRVAGPRATGPPGRRGGGVADPRAVALLLAAVNVLMLLGTPAENLLSRKVEAHADAHALNLTRDPVAFARMQRDLAVRDLSDLRPNAFDYLMYATHPTGPQRIAMARDWARVHHVPQPPSMAHRR